MDNIRVTASVYNTNGDRVRVLIPSDLRDAQARAEIGTGLRLCGYHRGRRWGVVRVYNIWTRPNGEVYGDEYTAYDLRNDGERAAFYALVADVNAYCYEY